MAVNDYIEIAQKATGNAPEKAAEVDHSAQVAFGLNFAKRQAERQDTEAPKIPPLGTVPLAN